MLGGLNPSLRVPTLVFEDGRSLGESGAILWYFGDGTRFVPEDPYEQAQVLQWMFFEQYDLEPSIAVVRFWVAYSGRAQEFADRLPERMEAGHRALAALDRHLDASGLRVRLHGVTVREIVLAHELFHHLAATMPMPAAVRPEVDIMQIGRWRRRAVVRAAEEIAAAGFAAAWCDVDEAPALLDAATLEIQAVLGSTASRTGRRTE